MGTPAMLGQLGAQGLQGVPGGLGNLPPGLQMQVQALQQQVQGLTQVMGHTGGGAPQAPQLVGVDANGTQIPPPPPPPPPPFNPLAQGGLTPAQPNHGHGPGHPVPHAHGTQNNPANPIPLAQQHANNIPPPPPLHHHHVAPGQPLPVVLGQPNPHHHHQHAHHQHHLYQHPLYTTFLRFEREIGLESLCLSLHETLRERAEPTADTTLSTPSSPSPSVSPLASPTPAPSGAPEVKIVCIMRIPRRELERLVRLYPGELCVDERAGFDARTKFRRLHGVEVSLELSGYAPAGSGGGGPGGEDGGPAV